jgi:hypothetical protein
MARKQKRVEDSPEHWEKVLREAGLSMERGRSKRISYVGGTAILDSLHGAQMAGTRLKGGDLDISYHEKGN